MLDDDEKEKLQRIPPELLASRGIAKKRRERDDPIGDLIRKRDRKIRVLLDDDLTPTPWWWGRLVEGDGPLGDD